MYSILVVDDEDGFLQIMDLILTRAGYRTLTARNGIDGLNMVYEYQPDLVILDDMMPGMSGGEVCTHIKSDPNVASIPVLMYSAGSKVRNKSYLESIQADGVMFKPCLPKDVLGTVASILPQHS